MPDADRPLVIVANRLPVSRTDDGWRPSSGGLVTALRPVVARTGGTWIGWDDDPQGVPARVDGLDADLVPVELSRAEVQGYYHGFANRTLWPLHHDLVVQPVIDRGWWSMYEQVNEHMADTTVAVLESTEPDPLIWVHDYHLMLLPGAIRRRAPGARVGFFLHIPFPPPELFARLPWRGALLDGLLAADAIGVHTPEYRDNLLRTVGRLVPDAEVIGHRVRMPNGHVVEVAAHPISIDATGFAELARAEETEQELAELRHQFASRRVLLGVDRLDYTKGIRHRLQSIEQLFADRPERAREVAFVQVAVPSRDDVREYRDLRVDVETEVGRINGRFTEPGHDVPVHYLYRGVSRAALAAYYRLADVMCVTPLKDGMNLVAKEFVTVQDAVDGDGVLMLSEFCGTAMEFGEHAVRCNPFDVDGQSRIMDQALAIATEDRRDRLARMAAHVRAHDVFAWVDAELDAIAGAS